MSKVPKGIPSDGPTVLSLLADQWSGLRFLPATGATSGRDSYHAISGFRKSGLWLSGSANGSTYARSNIMLKDEGILFGLSNNTTDPEENVALTVHNAGDVQVHHGFSKGSGSFDIAHPDPDKAANGRGRQVGYMKTYIDFARAKGVTLASSGPCQFCGGDFPRGVHDCVNVFELGFQAIDLSAPEDHRYRFLIVDAHALQHSELHGRWSNHFHFTRLELMFSHGVSWTYAASPRLSRALDAHKARVPQEMLVIPPPGTRGDVTAADVRKLEGDEVACKAGIEAWGRAVHAAWTSNCDIVRPVIERFLGS